MFIVLLIIGVILYILAKMGGIYETVILAFLLVVGLILLSIGVIYKYIIPSHGTGSDGFNSGDSDGFDGGDPGGFDGGV